MSKMEDIKKLLEQEDLLISSSDDDEDGDSSVLNFVNNHEPENYSDYIISKKRNGEKRLPTRKPDPNVYNRNALLARENRRKKKVYLETIERELQDARKTNNALVKALKRQLKVAKRLELQKKYFESLITNQTEIMTLVNELKLKQIHETKSDKSPFSSASSNGDCICNDVTNRTSTTRFSSLNETVALSIEFDSRSDDLENSSDRLPNTSTYNDMWFNNGCHIDNLTLPESNLIHSKNAVETFNDDHSYVASTHTLHSKEIPEQKSEYNDIIDVEGDYLEVGVFCPNNNWNQASQTPPLQLLSDS